jgi:hypothetical protein
MPEYLKKELKYRTVEELKRILRYRKFFSKNTISSAQYYLAHQDELVPAKDRPSPNEDFPEVPHALLLLRMIKVKHLTTYLMMGLILFLLLQIDSYYGGERFFENNDRTILFGTVILVVLTNHFLIQRETRILFTYWVRILNTVILLITLYLIAIVRMAIREDWFKLWDDITEFPSLLFSALMLALLFELVVGWTLLMYRWIKRKLT